MKTAAERMTQSITLTCHHQSRKKIA